MKTIKIILAIVLLFASLGMVWNTEEQLWPTKTKSMIFAYRGASGTLNNYAIGPKETGFLASFTRTLTATYFDGTLTRTAAANMARFQDGRLLLEAGGTNKCIQSRNITPWSSTYTPTLEQTRVGIDGVANTAWLVGDNDTGQFESKYYVITVPNDSNMVIYSLFIKKDSDTSRFPNIMGQLTGGTGIQFGMMINTNTGAYLDTSGTAVTIGVEDRGAYWRPFISVANNSTGNTSLTIYIYPAWNTTWATGGSATTMGTIVVDGVQVELGTRYPTSFIPTAGSEVSRTTETGYPTFGGTGLISFAYASGGVGTLVCDFVSNVNKANHTSTEGLAGPDTFGNAFGIDASGLLSSSDGTTTTTKDISLTRGTLYRGAVKWNHVYNYKAVGGGLPGAISWSADGAYDQTYTSGGNMYIGVPVVYGLQIQNVWFFNSTLTDGQINMLRKW